MNILIRCAISASLLSFLLASATPGPPDAVVPQSESGPPSSITDVINFSDGAMLPPWEAEAGFHDLVARARGGFLWNGKIEERLPANEIFELLDKLEKDLDKDQSISSGSKEKKQLEDGIVGDLTRLPILIGRLHSPQSPMLTEEKKDEIGLRLVNGIAKAKTNVATWPQLDQSKYHAKVGIKACQAALKEFSHPPSLGTATTKEYLETFMSALHPQSLAVDLEHLVLLISQMSIEDQVSMQQTLDEKYVICERYMDQTIMTTKDRNAALQALKKWNALNTLAKGGTVWECMANTQSKPPAYRSRC